jgi:hypothetical protein
MINTKHTSGTHISMSPKILIAAVTVHLSISRLYSEVELKNLFNFC